MRLRINVQRHGLPETPVVWNVESSNITISKLLEEVNDAIPIESGEWGFEDYAVELKGTNGVNFECLHYQPVGKVFKEDDEIIIRPLLTQDLKIRKISGRHQISSDGKHLVDGLAFGRPLLRRPAGRPAVKIPPRKKRRITYHESEDEEDKSDDEVLAIEAHENEHESTSAEPENKNQQLILAADFEDDDSDDEEDFIPGEELDSEEDLESSEEPELDDDSEEQIDDQEREEPVPEAGSVSGNDSVELEGDQAPHGVEKARQTNIRKLHAAFPTSTLTVCEHVLKGSGGDIAEAYEALARGFRPSVSKSSLAEKPRVKFVTSKAREQATVEVQDTVDLGDDEGSEEEEEREEDLLVNHYDQNGLPPGSISSGKALSYMAAHKLTSQSQLPRLNSRTAVQKDATVTMSEELVEGFTSTPFIDRESQIPPTTAQSRDESTDDTSTSGSSSEEDSEEAQSDEQTSSSESDSDDSSDSTSDSDDTPEETSSKKPPSVVVGAPQNVDKNQGQVVLVNSKPGSGSKSTRSRNQRRRTANMISRYVEKGILPAGITTEEFRKLHITSESSPEEVLAAVEEAKSSGNNTATTLPALFTESSLPDEFEARKQQLLASLAAGGVEVGPSSLHELPPSRHTKRSSRPSVVERSDTGDVTGGNVEVVPSHPSGTLQATPSAATSSTTSANVPAGADLSGDRGSTKSEKSRSKLDLSATQRLLFGHLGKKAPKSQSDKDKLRADLMKDTRPAITPKSLNDSTKTTEENIEQISDAWRTKINYRAVECCYDDVELSEPPFPFVQRWDPSQQFQPKGKRKRQQHEQSQYQDDSQSSKKQRQLASGDAYSNAEDHLNTAHGSSYQEQIYQDDSLVYDDVPTEETRLDDIEDDPSQQLMQDLNQIMPAAVDELEDLVPLPVDISALPDLLENQARQGMTIAFKQLIMSEETKWQPVMSEYRTAIIVDISEDGELHLLLAIRDRKGSKKEFDEETGKRIYGKFEMPDDEEEEEGLEDDGALYLSYDALSEPKVVQDVSETQLEDAISTHVNATQSSKLTQRGESAEAQASHVTETQIYPDAPQLESDTYKPSADSKAASFLGDEPDTDPVLISASKSTEQDSSVVPSKYMQGIIENPDTSGSPKQELSLTQEKYISTLQDPTAKVRREHQDLVNIEVVPKNVDLGFLTADVLVPSTKTKSQPLNEEWRQQILGIIKDAGFTSSVPSSTSKITLPEGMASPGEAALIEELRREMAVTSSNPIHSPQFHGIGASSPLGEHNKTTLSPAQTHEELQSSPPKYESSWETVGDGVQISSSPQNNSGNEEVDDGDDEENWETIEQDAEQVDLVDEDELDTPVSQERGRSKSLIHDLINKSGLGDAKRMWEKEKARRQESTIIAIIEDTDVTSEPPHESGEEEEASPISESANSAPLTAAKDVEYPKVSLESSFTSVVSDHGRQPDTSSIFPGNSLGNSAQTEAVYRSEPDNNVGKVAGTTRSTSVDVEPFIPDEENFDPDDVYLHESEDEMTDIDVELESSPRADSDPELSSGKLVSKDIAVQGREFKSDLEPGSSSSELHETALILDATPDIHENSLLQSSESPENTSIHDLRVENKHPDLQENSNALPKLLNGGNPTDDKALCSNGDLEVLSNSKSIELSSTRDSPSGTSSETSSSDLDLYDEVQHSHIPFEQTLDSHSTSSDEDTEDSSDDSDFPKLQTYLSQSSQPKYEASTSQPAPPSQESKKKGFKKETTFLARSPQHSRPSASQVPPTRPRTSNPARISASQPVVSKARPVVIEITSSSDEDDEPTIKKPRCETSHKDKSSAAGKAEQPKFKPPYI